jgi:hypothetical protein
MGVLQLVLDRLRDGDAPAPLLSLAELRRAGFATGLTALLAEVDAAAFGPELGDYLADQREQVAARVERFRPVIGMALAALHAVGVPATPVKGAELVNGIWPWPSARPMSDIDLIVPTQLRAQAGAAMVAAGFAFESASPNEDAFRAWGDGTAGRSDGESVAHNGRVEIHPGWGEFLHGYVVAGAPVAAHTTMRPLCGSDCFRLDLDGVTAHVVGHLSSSVVRCEVRAVNIVDVWFCHRASADWSAVSELLDGCDPRLAGPGLWLVSRLLPGVVPGELVDRHVARLPVEARRLLECTDPSATLRDPSSRTTLRWRQAFAMHGTERLAVLRQMARSKRVRR